jgi:hypothetical protein
MTTKTTRSRTVKSTKTDFVSKSAWCLTLLQAGFKVKEIQAMSVDVDVTSKITVKGKPVTPATMMMGYSFIYGIAKRAGLADTAADRKNGKSVQVTTEFVTVRCDDGTVVTIDRAAGKVKTVRPKPVKPATSSAA